MYHTSKTGWFKHADFMLWDLVVLHIAFCLAHAIRFPRAGLPYGNADYRTLIVVMSFLEIVACLSLNNLNDVLRRDWGGEVIPLLLLTFALGAISALYMFSAHTGTDISRLLIFYTLIFFFAINFFVRNLWKKATLARLRHGGKKRQEERAILILSDSAHAEEIADVLREDIFHNFVIRGVALVDKENRPESIAGIPVIGDDKEAPAYICREWLDEVFVYLPECREEPQEFLDACKEMGITLHTVLGPKKVNRNKQFLEEFNGQLVLTTAYNYVLFHQVFIKRLFDILGGLVGSAFTLLLTLVLGPMIYAKSPGPIFFRQKRVGRNGKIFNMYKFRSMYPDAEERKKELMARNRILDGMMFKLDFDPRIIGNEIRPDGSRKTGIGEFIRKTSLDEFPQFFNVLIGSMSLVGTRPPTLDEWEKYELHHRARMVFKPGITGLWQVSGRSDITDFEEVVKLDTEYISNFRLSLDLKILAKTLAAVFCRRGAM